MYCSSTPSSFVKGRFALKPLTNSGVKLFCVQANCPTSCIDTGSCHKCLCFLDVVQVKPNILIAVKLDSKNGYFYVATMHEISQLKLSQRIRNGRLRKIDK